MSRRANQCAASMVLATCFLVITRVAHAIDISWINVSGGTFSTISNWSDIPLLPDRAPGPNDIAHFGLTADTGFFIQRIYTVSFTTDPTNQALVIEDDWVTFDLDGHVYLATAANPITIGTTSTRTGGLTITDGNVGVTSENSTLSLSAGGNGFLTVTTGGLLAGSAMDISVGGFERIGTLTVNNGGDIIAEDVFIGTQTLGAAPASTATITGGGSTLLTAQLSVGNAGTGTLNITAGGDVESSLGVIGNFPGSIGTATVNGSLSGWDVSGPLTVGDAGTGTLDITAGGRVENTSGVIGELGGSSGTANVDGINSKWINSGGLIVGDGGNATLNITNGAQVENTSSIMGFSTGSVSTATVNGLGSRWIHSGNITVVSGTLNITAAGQVQSADGNVGNSTNGAGEVIVSGANSQWINSGELTVGVNGQGTLDITAGGRVQNAVNGFVGFLAGSIGEVTVDGANSQWLNLGELSVGFEGQGALDIGAGGAVQNTEGVVGLFNGSIGEVTVDGANSQWLNSDVLTVGHHGQGTLSITAGGSVSVTNASAAIALGTTATGTVTVAGTGSTWTINGRLDIGGDSSLPLNGGNGTLRIQPGGTVNVTEGTHLWDDDFLFLEGGTLSTSEIRRMGPIGLDKFFWTSGTLHVGTYHGNLTAPNGGVLAPGNSAGRTIINGSYFQQPGGTLDIEIGGFLQVIDYDNVLVQGNVFLDGNLRLTLLNGFVPSAGTFTILNAAGSVTGAFANVANGQRLTTSNGLGSFVVSYGPGSPFGSTFIALSAFQTVLPGDYNGNGTVDAADYTLWRDHLGQTFTLTNENPAAATPGLVDAEDYAFWKSHFGDTLGTGSGATAGYPPGGSASAVPEPAWPAWFLIGFVPPVGFHRGRRQEQRKCDSVRDDCNSYQLDR